MKVLLLVVALAATAVAQFFPQELPIAIQPPPVQQPLVYHQFQQQQPLVQSLRAAPQQQQQQQPQANNYAHRAVLQNAAAEAQLPAHLTNPFYKNQRIANALAKESWFTAGENLVVDREAEKIPRQQIYLLLKHAALIRRRRR